MHYTLTHKRLHTLASHETLPPSEKCYKILSEMRALGLYLLKPEVLSSASNAEACGSLQKNKLLQFLARRTLPDRPGQCVVLVALEGIAHHTLLREAFPLVMRWQKNQEDSPKLPPKLRERATHIKECLGLETWGLSLDIEEETDLQPDLSEISGDFPSADLSMAISLCLAEKALKPRPNTFVSAAWVGEDIQRVGKLNEKIEVARWFHANHFFAHEEDLFNAESAKKDNQEITFHPLVPRKRAFASDASKPLPLRSALSPMYTLFGARPTRQEVQTPEPCIQYANLFDLPRQRDEREEYMLYNVTDALASEEQKRLRLLSQDPNLPRQQIAEQIIALDRLVVVPSGVSSCLFSILATSARSVLVLYTKQISQQWERLRSFQEETNQDDAPPHLKHLLANVELQGRCITEDGFAEIARLTTDFLRGKNGGVDVTGGTKAISTTIALAAQTVDALVFSISSSNRAQHTAGTERIVWIPYHTF